MYLYVLYYTHTYTPTYLPTYLHPLNLHTYLSAPRTHTRIRTRTRTHVHIIYISTYAICYVHTLHTYIYIYTYMSISCVATLGKRSVALACMQGSFICYMYNIYIQAICRRMVARIAIGGQGRLSEADEATRTEGLSFNQRSSRT